MSKSIGYTLTPEEEREVDEIMVRLMRRLSEPKVREHFNDPNLLVIHRPGSESVVMPTGSADVPACRV